LQRPEAGLVMDLIPPLPSPWDVNAAQFPRDGSDTQRAAFLVRYALLAPSTRNTQPWQFHVEPDAVEVLLDVSRWQRVADADQREMYISLGCAVENLEIAAAHFGYRTALDCLVACQRPTLVARIRLMAGAVPTPAVGDPRFEGIVRRHTNHGVYEDRPLSPEDRDAMMGVAVDPGLRIDWMEHESQREALEALVMRADALLFADPEYRRELADLIGAGTFGAPWLFAMAGRFAVAHLMSASRMAAADHKTLASSPALGVISAQANTREAQVRVGQVLERLYLEATLHGLSLQPVSQLLEAAETRAALRATLPDPAWHPLQPFRLGYAKEPRTHTPRRGLEEVLI
jgi:nitroreductase